VSAGLETQPGELSASATFCEGADPNAAMPRCDFPMSIDAQSSMLLYIRVDDLEAELTCNTHVEERGLVAGVQTVDDQVVAGETTTRTPFSNDCSAPPAPVE
jgi:hypothetical protein